MLSGELIRLGILLTEDVPLVTAVRDFAAPCKEDGGLCGRRRREIRRPIRYSPRRFGKSEVAIIFEVDVAALEIDFEVTTLMTKRTGTCPSQVDRDIEDSACIAVNNWNCGLQRGRIQIPSNLKI